MLPRCRAFWAPPPPPFWAPHASDIWASGLNSAHLNWTLTFLPSPEGATHQVSKKKTGCGIQMHNLLPTLCPSQGQMKSQILKSPITVNGGFADLQGSLSRIDLMGHIDNSPISLPKTCWNIQLCDCLFGIQGHHLSCFSLVVTKTFGTATINQLLRNRLTAMLNTDN